MNSETIRLAVVMIAASVTFAAISQPPAPDPSVDLDGFLAALRAAFDSSALLGVILAIWGIARGAYALRDKIPGLAGEKTRRLIVGGIGVLLAASTSVAATGALEFGPILGAIGAAVAVYISGEPQPPPA